MKKLLVLIGALALAACNGGSGDSGSSGFSIMAISPANTSQITGNQVFLATFNNQLNTSTINNVSLTSASGTAVGLTCVSAGASVISCTPVTTLAYGSSYTLTYGAGIKNVAGNSLAATSYNYNTPSVPQVSTISPSNGASLPLTGNTFTVVFSSDMDTSTFNNTNVILLNGAATNVPLNCSASNSSTMSCVVSQNLTPLTTYNLTLTSGLKSNFGAPLTQVAFSYSTGGQTYAWSSIYSSATGYPTLQGSGANVYATIASNNNVAYIKYDGSTWSNAASSFTQANFNGKGSSLFGYPPTGARMYSASYVRQSGDIFGAEPWYISNATPSLTHWGSDIYMYNNSSSSWNMYDYWTGLVYGSNPWSSSGAGYSSGLTGLPNGTIYWSANGALSGGQNFNTFTVSVATMADIPTRTIPTLFLQPTNQLVNDGVNIYSQGYTLTTSPEYHAQKYTVANNSWADITANLPSITQTNATYLFGASGVIYAVDTSKTSSPIFVFNGTSWVQLTTLPDGATAVAYFTDGNNIFISGTNLGLYQYSISTNQWTTLAITGLSSPIWSITTNNAGNLYLGTNNAVFQGIKI